MTDIVECLRREVVWESDVGDLLNAAADEIERLRQFDRSQPIETAEATPDTHATPSEGSVQGRCTLTAEEREAIESSIWDYAATDDDENCARMVATLRNLLERYPSASSR